MKNIKWYTYILLNNSIKSNKAYAKYKKNNKKTYFGASKGCLSSSLDEPSKELSKGDVSCSL